MRKTIKEFFKVLLATLVPSGLTYLANSDYFFQKLIEKRIIGESFNITQTQDVLLVLGIVSSVLLLSVNLLFSKIRYNRTTEQRDQLLTMNAEIMKSALKPLGFGDFDIRIFIPEHPIYYKILGLKKDVLGKKVFIIKNIQTLATCNEQRTKQERSIRDRRKEQQRIINAEEIKNGHRNSHRKREKQDPRKRPVRVTHTRMTVNKQVLRQHEKYNSERNKLTFIFFKWNKVIMKNFKAGICTNNHRKCSLQQEAVACANGFFANGQSYHGSDNRDEELRNMLVVTGIF